MAEIGRLERAEAVLGGHRAAMLAQHVVDEVLDGMTRMRLDAGCRDLEVDIAVAEMAVKDDDGVVPAGPECRGQGLGAGADPDQRQAEIELGPLAHEGRKLGCRITHRPERLGVLVALRHRRVLDHPGFEAALHEALEAIRVGCRIGALRLDQDVHAVPPL